jgi:protoporphyrinogen oxidase
MRELSARIHPLPACALTAGIGPQISRLPDRRADDQARTTCSPDNWIYIHDSKVQVGRVQNFRSWSPEMVPDPAIACVGLEYFCFEGDGLWSSSDDDLVALATKEMAILGLCDPDDVVGGAVVRQEKAYPVYDDSLCRAMSRRCAANWKRNIRRCTWSGRNGMHRYNNQDHAMMTAMLTVREHRGRCARLRYMGRQRGRRIS